ncbi:hypothetical protein V6Z12_A01G147800 [Gossypium hirsutum]
MHRFVRKMGLLSMKMCHTRSILTVPFLFIFLINLVTVWHIRLKQQPTLLTEKRGPLHGIRHLIKSNVFKFQFFYNEIRVELLRIQLKFFHHNINIFVTMVND